MQAQEINGVTLESALAIVRAAGFKVTKAKAAKVTERPAFNCLGKPMSALYDPNYKMRNKATRAPYAVSSAGLGIARGMFKQAIEAKHNGNAALIADILLRNGVR